MEEDFGYVGPSPSHLNSFELPRNAKVCSDKRHPQYQSVFRGNLYFIVNVFHFLLGFFRQVPGLGVGGLFGDFRPSAAAVAGASGSAGGCHPLETPALCSKVSQGRLGDCHLEG